MDVSPYALTDQVSTALAALAVIRQTVLIKQPQLLPEISDSIITLEQQIFELKGQANN
jgi:hypothetical protein